ncbi:hypothetical protein CVT25_010408 [Psilocybe cyanescens]|uniref:Peptidase C14 caspase domain-containing protein n=1 Tax=Psilocybe cyanescens TaxID=93625 RepID=A0A409X2P2_PSICY|nr:hypothetical protein CVT25_010408 [Psilocybe cyanescens]
MTYAMNGDGTLNISPSTTSESNLLYALIIGIDTYNVNDFLNLHGATADAQLFRTYLIKHLSVPESRIKLLLDTEATRAGIIDALEGIANASNDEISSGAPIVVFYAGHGTEREDVLGGQKTKIQMLVPVDCAGIPDFIIGMLLDHVAHKKGDNITVIFDCCNSASGTRGATDNSESAPRTRAIPPERVVYDKTLDNDLYKRIRVSKGDKRYGFGNGGVKSHMLLAACRSFEEAKEVNGHGVFTSALLKLFNDKPPTVLRYCDILDQMDVISGQNPQCEGYNHERMIFNGKCEARTMKLSCDVEFRGSTSLVLQAGAAQGITTGAKFALFDSNDNSFASVLGSATVGSPIQAFNAPATLDASSKFDLARRYVAVQTRLGIKEDLRLYIPRKDPFHAIYTRLLKSDIADEHKLYNITLVEHKSLAHLEASMSSKELVFKLCDTRATKYGFSKSFKAVPTDNDHKLAWVLNGIAHYYRELDRRNPQTELDNYVTLEFYKLKDPEDTSEDDLKDRWIFFEPVQPNFCNNNIIDFVIEEECPYGFKLTNNSSRDLYPYVFIFDNNDLSIESYYMGPTSAGQYEGEPPLKARGVLTLGHGSNSVFPRSYEIKDDHQDIDVGFLKIFLTTNPINLNNVSQKSPFDVTRSSKPFKPKPKDKWDALTIPMIQRKRSAS